MPVTDASSGENTEARIGANTLAGPTPRNTRICGEVNQQSAYLVVTNSPTVTPPPPSSQDLPRASQPGPRLQPLRRQREPSILRRAQKAYLGLHPQGTPFLRRTWGGYGASRGQSEPRECGLALASSVIVGRTWPPAPELCLLSGHVWPRSWAGQRDSTPTIAGRTMGPAGRKALEHTGHRARLTLHAEAWLETLSKSPLRLELRSPPVPCGDGQSCPASLEIIARTELLDVYQTLRAQSGPV
ncbi:hypothetical protein J1605_006889 [Eschrichtius robustus]|uniref:Uncharacterized protein n=1 Tax=Eschrichtius robustus TaxID=9764 RepID=A0AB34H5E7_ESCRO|nr:hypothetical protein J1605_006889 [Eschrichtius robustus]